MNSNCWGRRECNFKYVLGTSGHDGVTAVVIKNVATRVDCANTLGVALCERGGATWRIQHTTNAKPRLVEAGEAFRAEEEEAALFATRRVQGGRADRARALLGAVRARAANREAKARPSCSTGPTDSTASE